jgi:acyl-CoA synthetase (AMP-forming)/AMP-acid ligase II
MEREIGRGDRLALLAPSSLEWIAASLGTIRAGATPVPLDVQFDDDALLHVLATDHTRIRAALSRALIRLTKSSPSPFFSWTPHAASGDGQCLRHPVAARQAHDHRLWTNHVITKKSCTQRCRRRAIRPTG